jgi:hypothetical protein
MTKQILILIAACMPIAAQIPATGNAFQQKVWWLTTPDPGSAPNKLALPPIDGQTGPVVGKPVSASEVRHNEQRLFDGSRIHADETERFYRDVSGRMRIETSTGVMIFDPVAGFTYELTDRKTYMKYPSGKSAVTIAALAHRSSAHSWKGKPKPEPTTLTEELTPQTVNGVYARGARVTTTIPAGTIGNDNDLKVVNERWYSDDLKLLLKSSNSDPRFGLTTYELTNISQTPPDPALFQIPPDYTEGH